MPFLSLSNPRSRASLIVAFLIFELLAILWLRESSPKDGSGQRPSLFSAKTRQQHLQEEEVLHLHIKKQQSRHQPASPAAAAAEIQQQKRDPPLIQHEQRMEGQYTGPVVARSKIAQDNQEAKDATTTTSDSSGSSSSNNNGNREQGSGEKQKGHHQLDREAKLTATKINQSISRKAGQSIKSRVSALAAAAVASIPKARKIIKESSSSSSSSTKNRNNNNSRSNKNRKSTASKHPSEAKNHRGGFRSTLERKRAQLIPVLDEHGVTIEDHFISPRDSDGDGVPDYFVLLRPSTENAKYMMDMSLFDDDTVVVPATPPANPPVAATVAGTAPSPIAPATPLVGAVAAAAPMTPDATSKVEPVAKSGTVPASIMVSPVAMSAPLLTPPVATAS